jgi:hypothetical protein
VKRVDDARAKAAREGADNEASYPRWIRRVSMEDVYGVLD